MMKRIFALILTLLMTAILFTSCGVAKEDVVDNVVNGSNSYAPTEKPGVDVSQDEIASDVSRKIIKTYHLAMETLDFDTSTAAITAKVAAFGGYIAESSQNSNTNGRYASYTFRIPTENAEDFLAAIRESGNVFSSSLSTQDITDSYYDLKSQLESLEQQESRLLEMLEKAYTLDYMLQIEDKLRSVRQQISSIHYRIQLMDKSVDYSYIYLTLSEVKTYQPVEEQSYFQKIAESFKGAFRLFARAMKVLLLVIIWMLPFLILGSVIAIVVIAIHRKKKKRKNTDKQDPPANS